MGLKALPGQPARTTHYTLLLDDDTAPAPVLCFPILEGWECWVGPSEGLKSALKLASPKEQGHSLLGLEGGIRP